MEWIAGGFLAFSCLVHASVSPVNACLFLACILRWHVWRHKQWEVKQQNMFGLQESRIEISSLLGSIGAPPLSQQDMPQEIAIHGGFDFILDFSRAHVDFFNKWMTDWTSC